MDAAGAALPLALVLLVPVLRGTAAGCALTLAGLLAALAGVLLPTVPAPRVPAPATDPVGLAA